jgi:hypothetical protein
LNRSALLRAGLRRKEELVLDFSRHLFLSAWTRLGNVPGYYLTSREARDWNMFEDVLSFKFKQIVFYNYPMNGQSALIHKCLKDQKAKNEKNQGIGRHYRRRRSLQSWMESPSVCHFF